MANWVDNKIVCPRTAFDQYLAGTSDHQLDTARFSAAFPEYSPEFEKTECTFNALPEDKAEALFSTCNYVPIEFAYAAVQHLNAVYYFMERNEVYLSRLSMRCDSVTEEVLFLSHNEDYQQFRRNSPWKSSQSPVWSWGPEKKPGWIVCDSRHIIQRYKDQYPYLWLQQDEIQALLWEEK